MGHGLRVPLQVFELPPGTRYLVIHYDEGLEGSRLVEALGAQAALVCIKGEGFADVYIDNAAHREMVANPVVDNIKAVLDSHRSQ